MKIRDRLALQFTIIVASILLIFSIGIYYFSSTFRKVDFDSRLEMRALSSAKLLLDVKEIDRNMLNIIDDNLSSSLFELQVIILDKNNNLVYKNKDSDSLFIKPLDFKSIDEYHKLRFSVKKEQGIGLLFTSNQGEKYKVFAWAIDKTGLEQLAHLRLNLTIGFFLVIVIIAFAGYVFARRSLRPISNVVNQVEKITASKLNLRVDIGNGRDELAQLASTFNQMLQRLDNAFRMQRNFVSNASHELRTPLTAITGQIEVALMSKRRTEEYELILNSLLEDIKTLNSLSNGLLSLAQSSVDPAALKIMPVRVDELLYESKTAIQRRNTEYFVNIDFSEMPEDDEVLTIPGNPNLLLAAFNNIIDNACKFSENHKAEVKISGGLKLVVTISDSGIGIPLNEIEKVYEPFYRAKNSRTAYGHGIGLSLSKNIIELHNGLLNIHSQENIGTTVEIIFTGKNNHA